MNTLSGAGGEEIPINGSGRGGNYRMQKYPYRSSLQDLIVMKELYTGYK